MANKFSFEVIKTDPATGARAGIFHTPHGDIETPVYMSVGTQATVKGLLPRDVEAAGAQIVLSNSYHLYMRPGHKLVEAAGGLHAFMNWQRPILTDSGGFQVFSLAKLNDITDEGVRFSSHIDGSRHFFTPELVMEIENSLGADIIMQFDECSEYGVDYAYAKRALERTQRWLERCVKVHKREDQALFPIVQGNFFKDLRLESAAFASQYAKYGLGIGGLSVGEPKPLMYEMLDALQPVLPEGVPRYLICSTACSPRASRATAPRSLRAAKSSCATPCIKRTSPRWTKSAIAIAAGTTQRRTCATSSTRAKCWARPCCRCTTSPSLRG